VSYQTRSCVWARATENIKGILHALQLLQGSKLLRCLLGSCFAVDIWILVCSLSQPPLHAFSEIAVYVRHHGHPICFFFLGAFLMQTEDSRLLLLASQSWRSTRILRCSWCLTGMGETSSSTSHSSQDPSLLGYGFHGAIANSTAKFL